MKQVDRKTKIVCTLGPATDRGDVLQNLFQAGMNVARMNFSHGTHEEHLERVKRVKALRDEMGVPESGPGQTGYPVALLLDTKGPEIRLRDFENGEVELKEGGFFTLMPDDDTHGNQSQGKLALGNEERVSISYVNLAKDVKKGDRILLDDGLIELVVAKINGNDVQCRVVNGGIVKNKKGVNVPNVPISMPFVSERDRKDLMFAIENDFDYIAASFVRNAECVKELQKILKDNNGETIKIIAKIENREGVDNIDDIIQVADGIMVARGDMGVEIPFEELPSIQKEIIKKCYIAGKPVITATQMLDSMIRNPRPTRAEITDVANAIYDGTDAIMLSGETSIGEYPVEAVQTMSKIAVRTESDIDYIKRFKELHVPGSRNVTNAISYATCETAHALDAQAIISVTKSGYTAQMASKFRPSCQVVAPTVSKQVLYQLSLVWGVTPLLTEHMDSTDDIFDLAIKKTMEAGLVKNGDLVVITGGMPVGVSGTTNTLKVMMVGDVLLEAKGINKLAASGNLCVVSEDNSGLDCFNAGDILVISKTTDEILAALKNAAALITEEAADAGNAVETARVMKIPVIVDAKGATSILKSGTVVTVDASKGRVFSGVKRE